MYGGGFAAMPVYIKDLFGTLEVGAIHGRVLLAWSTAAVLGPVLVNYIRQGQIDSGVPAAQAYSITMYIMAGLLILGLICNLLVRPVNEKHHADGSFHIPHQVPEESAFEEAAQAAEEIAHSGTGVKLRWLAVGIPLAYGVIMVAAKVLDLFH